MIFHWFIPSYMISVSFYQFLSYLLGKMQKTLNVETKALKDEHKHQKVVDMFPNLLLDQLIEEYEHISSEALVEIVLQNMPNIDTKPKIPGYCRRLRSMLGVVVNILPCETVKTQLTKLLAINETVKMPDLRERMECLVCLDSFLVEDMIKTIVIEEASFFRLEKCFSAANKAKSVRQCSTYRPRRRNKHYELLPFNESMDPLLFWKLNEKNLSTLALLARFVFSPQASSAASERAFKKLRCILVDFTRNRIEPKKTSTAATHSFCRMCLEQHAKAATEDMPLARGGTGLKCMTFDCKNPIIFHEIQYFVTSEMAQKLGDRILEESVAQAGLSHLDRCRKCNCGVEMNAPVSVVPNFRCPNCKYEFCRSCERQWLGHYGKSCEKMALLEKKEGAMRLLEKRLSEAIVRKCPKCSLAFVKDGGCNMMKCRCGTTQCYICRENNIHYSHFCSHARTPNKGCDKCDKSCTQWEDPSVRDRQTMEAIKRGQQDQ